METAKAETANETTQIEEMGRLYRTLASAQAHIFLYLRNAADDDDLRKRATEIIGSLETIIVKYEDPEGSKCGDLVWNPITKRCE